MTNKEMRPKFPTLDYEDIELILHDENGFQNKSKTSRSLKRLDDEIVKNTRSKKEIYLRTLKCIKRHFNFDDRFDKYFEMATSGSGNEALKIDTIWSSSLLSLLFFYDAVVVNGGIEIDGIVYTKCYFEFKNPVLQIHPEYKHPSNMDCVLYSEKENAILFVESKFIEYVRDFRKTKIHDTDNLRSPYGEKEQSTKELATWFESIKTKFEPHYYYGLKQMITHYSGVMNFCNHVFHPDMKKGIRNEIIASFNKNTTIGLMEVIYDVSQIKERKYENYYNNYESVQKSLFAKMKNDFFKIHDGTTYQKLLLNKKNRVSKTILDFYSFSN